MSDFIVLGLVPGTNTELTFTFWLAIAGTLLALVVLRRLWRSTSLRAGLITLRLVIATHQRLSF